jgi:hypothetical protein
MKKIIYILSIGLFMSSCGEVKTNEETEEVKTENPKETTELIEVSPVSKKGAWTESELDLMYAEIEKVDGDLEALGENKQAFIDCYTEHIIANYNNFNDANMDVNGCNQLATSCAENFM